MKKTILVVALAFVAVISLRAQQQQPTAGQAFQAGPRDWAFPVIAGAMPPEPDEEVSVPGSSRKYTPKQIDDLNNPPDWFPDQHPTPPALVTKGRGGVLACGSCHLMNGLGHPESADIAGLPADYIFQQMLDFKSGVRKDAARMNGIAKEMSEQEMREVATYFSGMKAKATTKVREAAMVPKTFVGGGRMRYLDPKAAGQTEPIGQRIITVPEDLEGVRHRDPNRDLFIAYTPPGTLARGKALAENGGNGRTIACAICHGEGLRGLGNVPRIAGMHPIYVARQLFLFKDGSRNGVDGQLMKRPVAQLTDEDVLAISAYVASLNPASTGGTN
jgi:cytochrome c553